MYVCMYFLFLLAPFLGASPTTSASILVEFGGNDWAAGCDVAHVFSHTYISPAVRHTPHARDLLFSITACEGPDPWLGTQGFDHKGSRLRQRRIPDLESLLRLPLDTIAHTGAGYECLVQEIAQQRFHGCSRTICTSYECKYVCMHALSLFAMRLSEIG